MKRNIKLLQKGTQTWCMAKYVCCFESVVPKIGVSTSKMGKKTQSNMPWKWKPPNRTNAMSGNRSRFWVELEVTGWIKWDSHWQKSNENQHQHLNRRKQGCSGLKWKKRGSGCLDESGSVVNHKSAFQHCQSSNAGILSAAVPLKHTKIIAWRKQLNFPSHLWWGCMSDQERWQSLPQ